MPLELEYKEMRDIIICSRSGIERGRADYPIIMPIRLLTQMKEDEFIMERLARLMDHREDRKREELEWSWVMQNVVDPIKKLDMDGLWSEDDIQRCVGLFRQKVKLHIYGFT